MPTGLFSLYIRSMALYEKNPQNNRWEKFLFWAVKIMGVVCIFSGALGLYIYVPEVSYASVVTSKATYSGWAILNIAKSILAIFFGAGFLIFYKKTLSIFSCYWIFIPLMIYLPTSFLRNFIYYEPTMRRITLEVVSAVAILFLLFSWFYYRKKYPEEFGLKS